MKTIIGIGLIILGVVSIFRYPDLGRDAAETIGALIGVVLFLLLPSILLIRSDIKDQMNESLKIKLLFFSCLFRKNYFSQKFD